MRWREETQAALEATRAAAEKLLRDRDMAVEAARLRAEMVSAFWMISKFMLPSQLHRHPLEGFILAPMASHC
jgi:hypothetical protein